MHHGFAIVQLLGDSAKMPLVQPLISRTIRVLKQSVWFSQEYVYKIVESGLVETHLHGSIIFLLILPTHVGIFLG